MRFTYMKDTEEQLLYYQFPKFLLEIPLSQNARIVYCLLYDRARISRKNQWMDEQGRGWIVVLCYVWRSFRSILSEKILL